MASANIGNRPLSRWPCKARTSPFPEPRLQVDSDHQIRDNGIGLDFSGRLVSGLDVASIGALDFSSHSSFHPHRAGLPIIAAINRKQLVTISPAFRNETESLEFVNLTRLGRASRRWFADHTM